MNDADDLAARRRAVLLHEEASRTRAAAVALEEIADEAERRLDPVLDRLRPQVWAGEGARRARAAAEDAGEDLEVAAASLREVARDLRWEAAVLAWRAEDLAMQAAGAGLAGAGR